MNESWHIANDTPVWFKPRRTVWFIVRHHPTNGSEVLTDKAGRRRYFKERDAALRALAKLEDSQLPRKGGGHEEAPPMG